MKLRFLSSNEFKIEEVKSILEPLGFEIVAVTHKIDELQTVDVRELTRDKCLKAYRLIGRPLFVEHTGLYIDDLNDFPAGLTQIFWDKLQADKVCDLFKNLNLIARTVIGYCDGKRIHFFDGEIRGAISNSPRGDRAFQWDCVFIPEGHAETFSELGKKIKNEISMRKIALSNLAEYLRKNQGC